MQAASQGELHLDERSFLLVEPEKFSGRANFPSGRFKTSFCRAVHGAKASQSWPLSRTRSSWHRRPIDGIGRECGKLRFSPCCSRPSRYPASILPSSEKGGVLIWP